MLMHALMPHSNKMHREAVTETITSTYKLYYVNGCKFNKCSNWIHLITLNMNMSWNLVMHRYSSVVFFNFIFLVSVVASWNPAFGRKTDPNNCFIYTIFQICIWLFAFHLFSRIVKPIKSNKCLWFMNPFSYFYIIVHKSVITSCTLLMLLQCT